MAIGRENRALGWLLSHLPPKDVTKEMYASAQDAKSTGYFIALVAVGIAFTARFLLKSILGDVAPLLIFAFSVVVAAWDGGFGPGMTATALSALLGDFFFIEPLYSFRIQSVAERVELLLFLGIGLSISVLSQARLSSEANRQRLLIREQEARKTAEEANRIKDEFLATVSHELRTPLSAMLGWATILRKRRLDQEKTDHALASIERNARIQTRLVEDLLDVSRLITGQLDLVFESTQLAPLINAAEDAVRPSAEAKGIQLQSNFDPTVGQVRGDPVRLQQVVWNLLSNAVKFTPAGGLITVRLDRNDTWVQITVRDTGLGIAPEFLPYVFDRFRQANSKSGGLGLGLAITRNLVELHGGTIEACSDGVGKGCTFKVCLPTTATTVTRLDESSQIGQIGQIGQISQIGQLGRRVVKPSTNPGRAT
jgi:signal transduction histidine kinase